MRVFAAASILSVSLLATGGAQTARVQVVPDEAGRRVDVLVDGKPFTSYIYPTTLKKPSLFPIRTAKGTVVTRGFPLEPRPNERVDHPHHVGLWLNHGNVNGLDFWNNSDGLPAAQAPKMGTVVHRRVVEAKGGADRGELAIEADWVKPDGSVLLREQTRFVFRGTADSRTIDRTTTLTAASEQVVFRDSKEGLLGLRVARALEQPSERPDVYTDASGKPAPRAVNNTGVSGQYVSSEGLKGDAVWSTRGRWVLLGGTVESEPVTLAILDHPANPGYPTHWHARGYGLFAANPLGDSEFVAGKKAFNFTLEPGRSTTFRYRVLVVSGAATPEKIDEASRAFAKEAAPKSTQAR
jgi:hypothetical protein